MEHTRTRKRRERKNKSQNWFFMHLKRPLFPHTHSREYLMHKYWSRKPHNIVASYVEQYSKEGDVILDPFGGSGVTLNEALHLGRRCISIDVNELSTFIAINTINLVDVFDFEQAALEIIANAEKRIKKLYITKCVKCGNPGEVTHVLWKDFITCTCGEKVAFKRKEHANKEFLICSKCNGRVSIEQSIEARPYLIYYNCSCNAGVDAPSNGYTKDPDENDLLMNEKIEKSQDFKDALNELKSLSQELAYPNSNLFNQLRHHLRKDPRLYNLFTPRNLISLHLIIKQIMLLPDGSEPRRSIKQMLLFLFSSMIPQASKMVWVIKKRKSRALSRPEVGSWTHHILWNPTEYFEVNVLNGFMERLKKIKLGLKEKWRWEENEEGWLKVHGKDEDLWWLVKKSKIYPNLKVLKEFSHVPFSNATSAVNFFENDEKTALLLTRSSEDLTGIPTGSIDYIFTDPPYGDSIQYLELSMFYLAWLPPFDIKSRIDRMTDAEITINPKQDKQYDAYGKRLRNVFEECHRVLKDDRFMTITFHNTDMKVRGIIFDAMLDSGFIYQQINYQPPPRPSEKSLLHEFGTPVGDYIITFKKSSSGTNTLKKCHEAEKILERALDEIFSARREPVPFNFLLNLVDIQLLDMGYFPPITSKSLKDFLLSSEKYTWMEKKGWFLKNGTNFKESKGESLSTRIDSKIKQILSSYKKKGNIEIIINTMFGEFNGILTPNLNYLKKRITRFLKE
ncbi:MAG: DNA methyltransferase [Candidatus Hodarchaeota archaeon]